MKNTPPNRLIAPASAPSMNAKAFTERTPIRVWAIPNSTAAHHDVLRRLRRSSSQMTLSTVPSVSREMSGCWLTRIIN